MYCIELSNKTCLAGIRFSVLLQLVDYIGNRLLQLASEMAASCGGSRCRHRSASSLQASLILCSDGGAPWKTISFPCFQTSQLSRRRNMLKCFSGTDCGRLMLQSSDIGGKESIHKPIPSQRACAVRQWKIALRFPSRGHTQLYGYTNAMDSGI